MAQFKNSQLNNLESITEMVGAYVGMVEGVNKDDYISSVIRKAHNEASYAFDMAIAAAASADSSLSHMYEFGTAGITRGPTKFGDPMHPSARLWTHNITGIGGAMDIGFAFRPALAANPKPTVASTGVASKYLRLLKNRKYVFRQKAIIMESGLSVKITPKNGQWLFVPFYGQPVRGMYPNKRGYMMWNGPKYGAIESTPGEESAGRFNAFWLGWWGTEGDQMLQESIRRSIESDMRKATSMAAKEANKESLKHAHAVNVVHAGEASRVKSASWFDKLFRKKVRNVGG